MVRKIQWEEEDATDVEMEKTTIKKGAKNDNQNTEDEIESEDSEEIGPTAAYLRPEVQPISQEFEQTEQEEEFLTQETEVKQEEEEVKEEVEDETQDLQTLEPTENLETEEEEEDVMVEQFSKKDVRVAKDLVRSITDYVSAFEKKAITSGFRPQGPPRDYPLSTRGQFKRKFRWPVQIRNVLNQEFELDSDEEDFLCEDLRMNRDTSVYKASTRLSKVSRPSMQTVIDTLPSRKRKRHIQEDKEEEEDDSLDKRKLRTLARLADHLCDDFLDSLLKKNLMALQGLDESLSQSCWIPLPTSQKPIANWRFVLETLARTSTTISPPVRLETLEKIKNRLFGLYANPRHLELNQHLSRLVQAYQVKEPPPCGDQFVNDNGSNVQSF